MGIRTPDIQLAKLALYQLSYTPALAAAEPLKNLLESFFSLRLRCLSLLLTAKTELCATVSNTLSLCFFRYKGLNDMSGSEEPGLAVDLRHP